MGKVSASIYVSIDGVMEEPAWTGPFWNEELANFLFRVAPCSRVGHLGFANHRNPGWRVRTSIASACG